MNKSVIFISVIVVLAAVVALAFFVFRDSSNGSFDEPLGSGPIVAFGDSLVEGVGATKGNDLPSLLSRGIGEDVVNLGVSGNTTAQAVARLDDVASLLPRVVIVVIGGNDFLRKVPRAETFVNLATIATRLRDSGARVVIVGVRGGLLSDSADGEFERVARETGSAYVPDILDGLFGDSRYMSDSIHPNDQGYARAATRILPVLKSVLER